MRQKSSKFNLNRRHLLKLGAGVLGTAIVGSQIQSLLFDSEPVLAQNDMTPDEALKKLMAGNDHFVKMKTEHPHQDIKRLKEVAQGQKPYAALLCCADSRVPPELLFDQGLGDLFVVRGAGNIATPEETGSLEYGVAVLGAKVLVVMGHQKCGAVAATIEGHAVPGQIGSIIEAIKPAVAEAKAASLADLDKVVKVNVKQQVAKLAKSPVLSEAVNSGKLKIVGAYYSLDTGKVSLV